MTTNIVKSKQRIKDNGEVFTPIPLVNEVLDKLPEDIWDDPNKTWLDNSCGNGNFLVEVKRRLMERGHSFKNVIGRIYGVDLMEDNIEECRQRMDPNNEYPNITQKNLITANGLIYHYRFDNSYRYEFYYPVELKEKQFIVSQAKTWLYNRIKGNKDAVIVHGYFNYFSEKVKVSFLKRLRTEYNIQLNGMTAVITPLDMILV